MNQQSIDVQHDDELPDPPDNGEDWERMPEDFREEVAERFETGIKNEWAMYCNRAQRDYRARDLRNRRTYPQRAA